MEQQLKIASFDDVVQSEFFKFDEGKRVVLALQNWKLFWSMEKEYEDKTKTKERVKITAEIVGIDGKKENKLLSSTSSRLILALRPFLENKQGIVFVSVKKIGKESATNYDVEPATPTVLQ